MKKLIFYTDGCSLGNPGPGGSGIVVTDEHEESIILKLGHGVKNTTNNERELYAVYMALDLIINNVFPDVKEIIIKSDSQYVINTITKGWASNWIRTGQTNRPNYELWVKVLDQLKRVSDMNCHYELIWVKGHAGSKYNELADQIAKTHAYENR